MEELHTTDTGSDWMPLKGIVLRETSQSPKATYCLVIFT